MITQKNRIKKCQNKNATLFGLLKQIFEPYIARCYYCSHLRILHGSQEIKKY